MAIVAGPTQSMRFTDDLLNLHASGVSPWGDEGIAAQGMVAASSAGRLVVVGNGAVFSGGAAYRMALSVLHPALTVRGVYLPAPAMKEKQ